jgi:broad specificity phosphatase PhoE
MRHAESWKKVEAPPEWTDEQRDALTERGEEQVRSWFTYPPTAQLLTSPANRARQTAAILGAAWSRPELDNEDLRPVEGGTQDDGSELTWDERTQLLADGQDVAGQGGRTLREAGESALAGLSTDAASPTLAVTHGDVIAGVMLATGDASAATVVDRIPPAAQAIVLHHVGGEWMVLAPTAAPMLDLPAP